MLVVFLDTELGLIQFKGSVTVQLDQARTQVGTTHVKSQKISFLFASGPSENECRKHGHSLTLLLETLAQDTYKVVCDFLERFIRYGKELFKVFLVLLQNIFPSSRPVKTQASTAKDGYIIVFGFLLLHHTE